MDKSVDQILTGSGVDYINMSALYDSDKVQDFHELVFNLCRSHLCNYGCLTSDDFDGILRAAYRACKL